MVRQRLPLTLVVCAVLVAFSSSESVFAQGLSTLSGRITDPHGLPVPGATVQAVNIKTNISYAADTSGLGLYSIPVLPPGTYRVLVKKQDFAQIVRPNVELHVAEIVAINFSLQIGSVTQSVTVSEETPLLQTENVTLGQVTPGSSIVALPLATRNFTQILALNPGTTVELPNAAAVGNGTQNISANGAQTTANTLLFNGVDANNIAENSASAGGGAETGVAIPAPDTIQEFKVQTALYSAAYGRSLGANVELVSKSGTNTYHGTAWEFFRNDALNANDFFLNRNGQPRPVLKQNQFGFVFGGPIRRNKTFFFGGYQGTIQRNGQSSVSLQSAFLPPLTNDRSRAALGALFAGKSGAQGGVAVAADGSNINPVALALLNYKLPSGQYAIPTPQKIVNGVGQFTFSAPTDFREDQFTVNLDHAVSDRNQLAGRVFFARAPQSAPFQAFGANLPGWGATQTNSNFMGVISDTHSFQSLVNVARFSWVRFQGSHTPIEPIKNSDVGITPPGVLPGIPTIAVSGLFTIGTPLAPDFYETTNTFAAQDSVSMVRGRHSLSIGAEFKWHQLNVNDPNQSRGELIFLSFPDFMLGMSAAQNGSSVSNVFETLASAGDFLKLERYRDFAAFIQDDIKTTGRLTLNLGVRYEILGPPTDTQGRLPNFDPSLAAPVPPASGTLSGIVMASNYHGPLPDGVTHSSYAGLYPTSFTNVAPRIGIALRLSDRLAFRSGYGIYYQTLSGQVALQAKNNPPFVLPITNVGAANAAATFQVPANPALPATSSFPIFVPRTSSSSLTYTGVSRTMQTPYAQQYNLGLQYEFARDFLWEIGYVGSNAKQLPRLRLFNQAEIATAQNPVNGITTSTVGNVAQRRPILGLGSASWVAENGGFSNYNSLQTSVTKRLGHGLSFLAGYTLSRSLDTTSGGVAVTGLGSAPYALNIIQNDQTNPNNAYGPSDFDRTHRFTWNFQYQLPTFRGGPAMLAHAASAWQFSGLMVFQSGVPFTILDSTAASAYGALPGWLRAQCTGMNPATSGSVEDRLSGYLNAAAFTAPPSVGGGTGFGDCGRNNVRGPDERNLDLSVQRSFHATEKTQLEFRTDIFNFTNTPKFGIPAADRVGGTSKSFGVISSTVSNPRIVQFALKLLF